VTLLNSLRAPLTSHGGGWLERIEWENENAASQDLEVVLPANATIALPHLALLLANPSLELSFIPKSLWVGVHMRRTIGRWPESEDDELGSIRSRFEESVRKLAGDGSTVAVAVSGGLDSLAVLYHADRMCKEEGRPLVALVADLVDDRGASSAAIVERCVAALGISCELAVFSQEELTDAEVPWSPAGPRFDAMPTVCGRMSAHAAAAGASVVLTGRGADELLMCSRYTSSDLVRRRRLRALPRYLGDMTRFDGAKGFLGELAALAAPRLSARTSFALLYAFLWSNAHDPDPRSILPPAYLEVAVDYHREWRQAQYAFVEEHGFDWAAVGARCAVYPRDHIPPSGDLSWVSPFFDTEFSVYAHRLSIARRYDETLSQPYHRLKAPVLALFPPGSAGVLPPRKQTFATACARYVDRFYDEPRLCLELGLIDPRARDAVAADPELSRVALMIEQWLRGAIDRGYEVGAECV
jgi:hypothetical protein